MAKISEHNKYLRSLHSKKQTPDEIIRSIVKEGTGKDIISKRKIIYIKQVKFFQKFIRLPRLAGDGLLKIKENMTVQISCLKSG